MRVRKGLERSISISTTSGGGEEEEAEVAVVAIVVVVVEVVVEAADVDVDVGADIVVTTVGVKEDLLVLALKGGAVGIIIMLEFGRAYHCLWVDLTSSVI